MDILPHSLVCFDSWLVSFDSWLVSFDTCVGPYCLFVWLIHWTHSWVSVALCIGLFWLVCWSLLSIHLTHSFDSVISLYCFIHWSLWTHVLVSFVSFIGLFHSVSYKIFHSAVDRLDIYIHIFICTYAYIYMYTHIYVYQTWDSSWAVRCMRHEIFYSTVRDMEQFVKVRRPWWFETVVHETICSTWESLWQE